VNREPIVLTMGPLDVSAEEGLAADVAVIAELGGRAACVATAILGRDRGGAATLEPLADDLIGRQIDSCLALGRPAAVRVGLVRGGAAIEQLADRLRAAHLDSLVFAPVVRVGAALVLDEETREAAARHLLPYTRVLVLRATDLGAFALPEVEDLQGAQGAAAALRGFGARAVLLTGLFVRDRVVDVMDDDGRTIVLDAARVHAPRVAGLASAHAVALATHLGRGLPLPHAAEAAQRYVGLRLQRAV
jgi:hydroxymethylpyrimidine/phosphomethylpyrimidine kinase